jgi:dipeptidyl aminopeptidase/acylaminoacyl peptidase
MTLLAFALAALGYAVVCLAIAWRFTTARRCAPAAFDGRAEPVSFSARDALARIDGWYIDADRPAADRPAVVFVHGKDGCRGDELKSPTFALAHCLADAGVAVLMIDLRGHGTSSRSRMTYGERERFDVLGAVDWLRGRGHARIGVLGASMGAATALLAAAMEPAIAAVVADSPFADFGRMIERQYRNLSRLPWFFLPGALLIGRLLTGVDLRGVRPLDAAPRLAGRPVLVIHSDGDRFVPPEDSRCLARAIGAECWTTPTRGHIGSYRALRADYPQRVLQFFLAKLSAPGAA